jgi:hypothetical protein
MEWYRKTEKETEVFFSVDSKTGLTSKDVLARISHFGSNNDPGLRPEISKLLKTKVIREGKIQIVALSNAVRGDVIEIEEGDRVPADIRLVSVDGLKIDQSLFTNEGLPADKNTLTISGPVDIRKQKSLAYMGSFVTSGRGRGIVVALGNDSLLKQYAKYLVPKEKLSDKKIIKKLHSLGIAINSTKKLSLLKKTQVVIIDMPISDEQALELLRHLQMVNRIATKFIVSRDQAVRLSEMLGVTYYENEQQPTLLDIEKNQFIVLPNEPNVRQAMLTELAGKYSAVLWADSGTYQLDFHDSRICRLVVGVGILDSIICGSDLFSPQATPQIIKSILYNNNKHKALDKNAK